MMRHYFFQIGMGGWFTGEYSLRCQPVDYSNKSSTLIVRTIFVQSRYSTHILLSNKLCFFSLQMVSASWWYYFSKFTEFFDTVILCTFKCVFFLIVCLQLFFVLRKKNDQISTLHVIHHGVMPMSVWFGVKFTPGKFLYAFTKHFQTKRIVDYIFYNFRLLLYLLFVTFKLFLFINFHGFSTIQIFY